LAETKAGKLCSLLFCAVSLFSLISQGNAYAVSAEDLSLSVTIQMPFHLHDGTSFETLMPLEQATDGTGRAAVKFRIQDFFEQNCSVVNGSFEYRVNGGEWLPIADADISGTKTGLISSADMNGPEHVLIWDTAPNYLPDNYYSNVQVRFKADNGFSQSELALSPLGTDIDNLDPEGMNNLQTVPARSQIFSVWDQVTSEHNWSDGAHYELWYGKNQADVEAREGTALEWDEGNDPDLALMTTTDTKITGLDPETDYYVKIWAVDKFGNRATLLTQSLTTLGDGTLELSVGPNNPASRNVSYKGIEVPQLQIKVRAGPAEDVIVSSITFHAQGTGDDLAHLSSVTLFEDANNNGLVDGSDREIATVPAYTEDDGVVIFGPIDETVELSNVLYDNTEYWLVAYDYAGVKPDSLGKTFQTVFQAAGHIDADGFESGAHINPEGVPPPLEGGVMTAIETGELTVSMGANCPSGLEIMSNEVGVPVMQLALTETSDVEDVGITSITFTELGTTDEQADIYLVKLYMDNNGNAVVDEGDTKMFGDYSYGADGKVTFTFPSYNLPTIPANSTKNILLLYDLNASAERGETFIPQVTDAIEVNVQGRSSFVDFKPDGTFPFTVSPEHVIVTGEVHIQTGPVNPAERHVKSNTTDLVMMQLSLAETTGREDLQVQEVSFKENGTAQVQNDIYRIRLYKDVNRDGKLDAGDTKYFGDYTYNAQNKVTFSFASYNYPLIEAGETVEWILVYDLSGTADIGETMIPYFESTDISMLGRTSLQQIEIPADDFPLTANGVTISDKDTGQLYLEPGENNPPDSNVFNTSLNIPVLQIKLSADLSEEISVSSLTITHSGTGDADKVQEARIYEDVNNDGTADAGDRLISTASAWSEGKLTFTPAEPEIISADSSENWLLVYDFDGTEDIDKTFIPLFNAASDISAQGSDTGDAIQPQSSLPVSGATLTIADRGSYTLGLGENTPIASAIVNDELNIPMVQFTINVGPIEGIEFKALTITHSGTAGVEDILNVKLYDDLNGNAIVDDGETELASGNAWVDNKLTLTLGSAKTYDAASTGHLLLVYDFAGTAEVDETFSVILSAADDPDMTGILSGKPITAQGEFPITGAAKTVVPDKGGINISLGANTAPETELLNNQLGFVPVQFSLEETSDYENVSIHSITFTETGTADMDADISLVKVYIDVDGDGTVSTPDQKLLGDFTYDENNKVTFEFLSFNYPTLEKGTVMDLMLVYELSGTAARDTTLCPSIASPSDIVLEGRDTGAIIVPSGVPAESNIHSFVTGEITASLGGCNPPPSNVLSNTVNMSVFQFVLTETTGVENVGFDRVVFTETGTADPEEDIFRVRVFIDNNRDGLLDDGDTKLLGDYTYDQDKKVAFAFPSYNYPTVPASGNLYLLAVYDLSGTALEGETLQPVILEGDLTCVGKTSFQPAPLTADFPLQGGFKTISSVPSGQLSINPGPANAPASNVFSSSTGVPMLQMHLATDSAENISLEAVTLTHSGTGNTSDIQKVKIYHDIDSNGAVDGGEPLLGEASVWTDNNITIDIDPDKEINASSSQDWLAVYDFNGTAAMDTIFTCSFIQRDNVTATGVTSGIPIFAMGPLPVSGGEKTVSDRGTASLSIGPDTPNATAVVNDETGIGMTQFRITAGIAEGIALNSLTLTHSGTAEVTGISSVYAYDDANSNGTVDDGESILASASVWTDDQITLSLGAAKTIAAGNSCDILIVYDFNGTAATGSEFISGISADTDTGITGSVSGLPISPAGEFPVKGNAKSIVANKGGISAALGAATPAETGFLNMETGIVTMQVELTETSLYEDVGIHSITFTETGTILPQNIERVSLYVDTNNNGELDIGTDTKMFGDYAYNAEKKVTFSFFSFNLPRVEQGTVKNLLLVYNLLGTAERGATIIPSIASESDLVIQGMTTGIYLNPVGLPVTGNTHTIVTGAMHVETGLANPASDTIANNCFDLPVFQVHVTETSGKENIGVTSVTFTETGTTDALADISRVRVYLDKNHDGLLDVGDTKMLGDLTYDENKKVTFNFATYSCPTALAGEAVDMLLIYDLNGTASNGETFAPVIEEGDITATGILTSAEILAPAEDFPVLGSVKTIQTGILSLSAGPANPADGSICKTDQDVEMAQIRLEETTGFEAITVNDLVFTHSGTGDITEDVVRAELYRDNNHDGIKNEGDDFIAVTTTFVGTEFTFSNIGENIEAGTSEDWLVIYDLTGFATENETFRVTLESADKVTGSGLISGSGIVVEGTYPIDGGLMTIATDPSGVVYDSLTEEPLVGVPVTIQYEQAPGNWVNATPGLEIAGGDDNPNQLTDAGGNYSFNISAGFLGGSFRLVVDPPAGYTFPSTVIAQGSRPGPGAMTSSIAGSHGEAFVVNGPETVHLPLDPEDVKVLKVTKEANKEEVVVGDIVTYTVTVENTTSDDIDLNVYLRDKLPAGFKYISGSTLLEGAKIPDPSGAGTRRFNIGTIAGDETKTLSYQLVVGSAVELGLFYENTATAISAAGTALSNPASARVKVVWDPIFDLSIIIGKVFNDINGNGIQDKGECGIPDVRIATEDGLYVVTDKDGKYHIEGLKPMTKLLKVDFSTLPEGSVFTTENPRVVRLSGGLLAKVNFGVQTAEECSKPVREKGKPYLEIKLTQEPTRIDPQLTAAHIPDNPQFSLKGDALENDIVFLINTNYSQFIHKWKLEIFSLDNRVSPLKVFKGKKKNIFEQIVWQGKDDKGKLVEPDQTYIYQLTVEDRKGNKDTTLENRFVISRKQTISRTEDFETVPEEFFSNKISTQTIPVESSGATVVIEGITDKGNKITVAGQELGIIDSGEFTKELIFPVSTKKIRVIAENSKKEKTVYDKKLNLKSEYFFLVALADGQMGKMSSKGNISPVRDQDKFRSGYYFDGRMAYYLKAKVKGKYLITSSFDSERRRGELARVIDEDKYYPVYGDSSSVTDDTNTLGNFYVLVEWDKSHATWGNYNSQIDDVDLAKFSRELYGGKFYYQSVATTSYGDPNTVLVLFGAESSTLPAHNEFVSTGGSIYYLKDKDVVEGSETVTIEVRDADTGLVNNTISADKDVDYSIDYDQGRIIFYKPVSMIASSDELIKDSISLGDPVYVTVDYEYEQKGLLAEGTYGGRLAQQINDHVKLGTTYIKEDKEDGYELKGADLTLKYGQSTEIKVEYAQSKSSAFANYISYDGGISFEDLPSDTSLSGDAVKLNIETDLGEIFGKKTNIALWEAYYQDISSGFSSQSGISQQGTEKYGMKLTWNVSVKDTLTFIYDYEELKSQDNTAASEQAGAEKTSDYTLQYKHTEDKYTLSGEYKFHKVDQATDISDDETKHTLAAKAEYNLDEKTKAYIQQQANIKGKADNKTIFGVIKEFSSKFKLKLEQMVGNRGTATEVGIDSQVDSKTRMYTTYSIGREKGEGRTSATTVGTETLLDKDTILRSEQEYKTSSGSVSASQIIGLEYNKDKWDFDLSLEKAEIKNQGEKTDRTAISLATDYTEPDLLKWNTKIEFRFDRASEDKDQVLLQNALEYKLASDWTFLTRQEYSRTYNKTTEQTEAEYKELMLGMAYRPVECDRLNMLGKISYIEDDGPVSQSDDADISSERAFVFALEGAYDLSAQYQLVEKFAYKIGEEKVGLRDYTRSETWLWINRMNYHLTHQWDAGLEYRILEQKTAQDAKSGFLCEVTRHVTDNFQFGVGYNFTDFSDDLTEEDDYSTRGFFIRITGKY